MLWFVFKEGYIYIYNLRISLYMLFSGSVNPQNDKSINDQQIHQRIDHAYINHPPSMSWLKPSGNVTPQLATGPQPTDKIKGLVSTTSFSVLEVSSFLLNRTFLHFRGSSCFKNPRKIHEIPGDARCADSTCH